MSEQLYLILHKVRGEPAFDVALKFSDMSRDEDWWIIPTSGHRAYPFRYWALDDLFDGSDINKDGFHERPSAADGTIPEDWPDHYAAVRPLKPAKPRTSSPEHDISLLFGG